MKNAFIFDRNKSEEARNDPLFIDDLKHFAKGLILFQMQSSNIYYKDVYMEFGISTWAVLTMEWKSNE